MNKSRLGALLVVWVAALLPATLGCALTSGTSTNAPDQASSVAGGSAVPATLVTDDQTEVSEPGSRTALVEDLTAAAEPEEEIDTVTDEGTDSVTTSTPGPLDAATRAQLTQFGELYLGFDYRSEPGERALALEPLVSTPLLAELATPLPAALLEELATEERVVTATLTSADSVGESADGGLVVRLILDVTTSTRSVDDDETTTDSATTELTVATDADGIVIDVR